jgi:DNA-binding transcriptional MerR regulator
MGNTTGKTSAKAIEEHKRKLKAVEMRENGFSLDEIADSLGWNSPQAVHKAIKSVLDKAQIEAAAHYKIIQVRRLEKTLASVKQKAENGNLRAAQVLVRLSKRLSEIVGSDAPAKFAQTDVKGNDKPQVIVYLPDNQRDS